MLKARSAIAACCLLSSLQASRGAISVLETPFDAVPHMPGDDTWTRSVWDDGGGLVGFSKAKAGYSIRTTAIDVPSIVYDWAIPGHHLQGMLQPGSLLFWTYGQESAVEWTTETCNLSPLIQSAQAQFWYINNLGFPRDQGPAQYHAPQSGGTNCQPSTSNPRESLKTLWRILDDDDKPAAELAEFESAVELTENGEYQYTYTVTNHTEDELVFDWPEVRLAGLLDPLATTSVSLLSPLPPMEFLANALASLQLIGGAPPSSTADVHMPSAAGLSMGGYSMILVPVPEPATLALLAGALVFATRRK